MAFPRLREQVYEVARPKWTLRQVINARIHFSDIARRVASHHACARAMATTAKLLKKFSRRRTGDEILADWN